VRAILREGDNCRNLKNRAYYTASARTKFELRGRAKTGGGGKSLVWGLLMVKQLFLGIQTEKITSIRP